jgi:hypothetical protein
MSKKEREKIIVRANAKIKEKSMRLKEWLNKSLKNGA